MVFAAALACLPPASAEDLGCHPHIVTGDLSVSGWYRLTFAIEQPLTPLCSGMIGKGAGILTNLATGRTTPISISCAYVHNPTLASHTVEMFAFEEPYVPWDPRIHWIEIVDGDLLGRDRMAVWDGGIGGGYCGGLSNFTLTATSGDAVFVPAA
jgi:hypothetical protein